MRIKPKAFFVLTLPYRKIVFDQRQQGMIKPVISAKNIRPIPHPSHKHRCMVPKASLECLRFHAVVQSTNPDLDKFSCSTCKVPSGFSVANIVSFDRYQVMIIILLDFAQVATESGHNETLWSLN